MGEGIIGGGRGREQEQSEDEEEEGNQSRATRTNIDIHLLKLLLESREINQRALDLLLIDWRFFSRHSWGGEGKGEEGRGEEKSRVE